MAYPLHPPSAPKALQVSSIPSGIFCFIPLCNPTCCTSLWVSPIPLWIAIYLFSPLHLRVEKEMATHSSILAWRIPGTGKPGGLPSMGSHRVGHDWSDLAPTPKGAQQNARGKGKQRFCRGVRDPVSSSAPAPPEGGCPETLRGQRSGGQWRGRGQERKGRMSFSSPSPVLYQHY